MTFVDHEVTVSVPATSANLGPGFDALGLALDLHDEVTAAVMTAGSTDRPVITVSGEGEGTVPLDEGHLVHRSMARAFQAIGLPVPGVRAALRQPDPARPRSGFVLGGHRRRCRGRARPGRRVAACSWTTTRSSPWPLTSRVTRTTSPPPSTAASRSRIPRTAGSTRPRSRWTHASRWWSSCPARRSRPRWPEGCCPETVSHRDAAAGAGRAALLVAALSRSPELLLDATGTGCIRTTASRSCPTRSSWSASCVRRGIRRSSREPARPCSRSARPPRRESAGAPGAGGVDGVQPAGRLPRLPRRLNDPE